MWYIGNAKVQYLDDSSLLWYKSFFITFYFIYVTNYNSSYAVSAFNVNNVQLLFY